MRANPELDQLLYDRFAITTDDFVAALKAPPPVRPWATSGARVNCIDTAQGPRFQRSIAQAITAAEVRPGNTRVPA